MGSKTPYFTKESVERPWYLVDMEGQVLGRAAMGIAKLLIGKNRPEFTPGQDCGGFVVVINADKFEVTGNKRADKRYWRYSGYPGGIYSRTLEERTVRDPEEVIRDTVWGMLPKNKIGKRLITKLKVYRDDSGIKKHQAQSPQVISAEELKRL